MVLLGGSLLSHAESSPERREKIKANAKETAKEVAVKAKELVQKAAEKVK